MNSRRIACLFRKEFAQLRRDRRLFAILILAPLIQLLVVGFAATTDIRHIAVAIRDRDHSRLSREYARSLGASGYFNTFPPGGPQAGDGNLLVYGRAGLVLDIPPGFGALLEAGRPAQVQALADGADSNFGVQGLNYLQKATSLFSGGLARAFAARTPSHAAATPSIRVESRAWYNPGLVSRVYMTPAIMALLMLVVTMLITSMALVKEREDGTLEQLMVTPLRPAELIAGKLLPYVMIGFIELTFALGVIAWIFRIPMRGSMLLLYAMTGLFLLTTLGIGLFISTMVKTQHQAMMAAVFFVMMPFMLLSGFAFPVENMPFSIQWVAEFIPLKHYLIAIRSIYLKGAGLETLWPEALALFAWGIAILALAALRFRKRLD